MDERIECVTSLCAPVPHRPLDGVAHPRSERINRLHSGGGRHWIRHAAGRVRHARGTGRVREVEPAARAGGPADRGRLRRRGDARARLHAAGRAGPPARPRHRAEDRPDRPRGRAPVRRLARPARARGHPPRPRARRPRRLRPLHRLLDGVPGRRLRRAARRAGGGPAVRDRRADARTSRSSSTCPSRRGSPASRPRSPGSRPTRTSPTTSASATGSSSFAAADPERYAIVDATLDEAAVLDAAIAALGRLAPLAECLRTAEAVRALTWRSAPGVNRSRSRCACHDERRTPRPGGRVGRSRRPWRRGAPGRAGRRTARGARRPVRALRIDGLRNRPADHRRRHPRGGRRPGRVSRRVAERRSIRGGPRLREDVAARDRPPPGDRRRAPAPAGLGAPRGAGGGPDAGAAHRPRPVGRGRRAASMPMRCARPLATLPEQQRQARGARLLRRADADRDRGADRRAAGDGQEPRPAGARRPAPRAGAGRVAGPRGGRRAEGPP